MDRLDVNDACKRFITNIKMHFCQWRNLTNARESNYTVIKLPRNGNSKAKNN